MPLTQEVQAGLCKADHGTVLQLWPNADGRKWDRVGALRPSARAGR